MSVVVVGEIDDRLIFHIYLYPNGRSAQLMEDFRELPPCAVIFYLGLSSLFRAVSIGGSSLVATSERGIWFRLLTPRFNFELLL